MSDENDIEPQDQGENEIVIEPGQPRHIEWHPKDFTIGELYNMKLEGDLDLQPEYQRNFVFDVYKASRLIESILMDVPIPVIYIAEEGDYRYSVIDGQQRLTSFMCFIEGQFPDKSEFRITGLSIMKELNRKRFDELDPALKKKIKKTSLHCIIINNESDRDIKFEIFERLNTGSVRLNEDEIRNTVYRGPYINLLRKIAEEDPEFHQVVRKDNFRKRMLYRGMILRFFALSEKTYLNYRPSYKQFCNKHLRDYQNLLPTKAEELYDRFKKCLGLCRDVFGDNAFRRFGTGDKSNPNGGWVVSRINLALFDVEMCGFVNYGKNQIAGHYDEIREALIHLCTHDDDFFRAIELQTSTREAVTLRFEKWLAVLKSIVSDEQPRAFSYEIKKQLFGRDSKCGICGNQILLIEDAEVDHIVPFSQGGKTVIENAQITHRYCNRHKSDKTSQNTNQCLQIESP
jgi:5-methylcytosine-specific restriction endonuclease McrA